MVDSSIWGSKVTVEFLLDNLRFDFGTLNPQPFTYEPNPVLHRLNQLEPLNAYRYNPGSFIQLEVRREAVLDILDLLNENQNQIYPTFHVFMSQTNQN